MRKLTEKFVWLQLLLGFILIGVGVSTIIIAINGGDEFDKTVFLVWAIVLFAVAAIMIGLDFLAFLKEAQFISLIIAGICIGLGIFVLANQTTLRDVISSLFSYILIPIGGVLLLKTIVLAIKRVGFKQWLSIFVVSVVFLSIGIIFLCIGQAAVVIYISIGVLLIVMGAIEFIGYVTVLANRHAEKKNNAVDKPRKKKHKKATKKDEPIEGEVIEHDDEEEVPEIVEGRPKEIGTDDDIKLIE